MDQSLIIALASALSALFGAASGATLVAIILARRSGDLESERNEFKRRLNRILETELPGAEQLPLLKLLYEVARGTRI